MKYTLFLSHDRARTLLDIMEQNAKLINWATDMAEIEVTIYGTSEIMDLIQVGALSALNDLQTRIK